MNQFFVKCNIIQNKRSTGNQFGWRTKSAVITIEYKTKIGLLESNQRPG